MNEPARAGERPQFSIVTPSYNYGRYIRECLESVRAQRGATWEHIVIDACSTDETASILAEYPDLRVVREPDGGMSEAINKGFSRARGEWVMWLNADDRLKPGALAEILRFYSKHPKLDVVYGTCDFVSETGAPIRRWRLLPFHHFLIVHHNLYVPSTATFLKRKTILDEGFLVDTRFRIAMDKEFYLRLSAAGKRFGYLPCALADFRWHESNLSKPLQTSDGLDSKFAMARQAIESEVIRRAYGWTFPSRNRAFTWASDFVLFMVAWGLKGLLKVPHYFRVREPRQGP